MPDMKRASWTSGTVGNVVHAVDGEDLHYPRLATELDTKSMPCHATHNTSRLGAKFHICGVSLKW